MASSEASPASAISLNFWIKLKTLRFVIANVPTHTFGVVQVFPVQDVSNSDAFVVCLGVCNNLLVLREGPLNNFLPISSIAGLSVVGAGSCKGTIGASRLLERNSCIGL